VAPAPAPISDSYDGCVHSLAVRQRDRILELLDASTVLSDRAKLIYQSFTRAGTASADWYLTTEVAEPDDGGGPGLGNLVRRRASEGSPVGEDEFLFVAVVCSFFYLFAVMADRDRLLAARTFVEEIGAPPALADLAHELERVYPTRRHTLRPRGSLAEYLALADLRLAEGLGIDNSPGLSTGQAAKVTARFETLYVENVLPVVDLVS